MKEWLLMTGRRNRESLQRFYFHSFTGRPDWSDMESKNVVVPVDEDDMTVLEEHGYADDSLGGRRKIWHLKFQPSEGFIETRFGEVRNTRIQDSAESRRLATSRIRQHMSRMSLGGDGE